MLRRRVPVIVALLFTSAAAAWTVTGCKRADAPPDPAKVERGRAALASFQGALKQALGGAIQSGGPAHAVDVCARDAPRLAADASKDGVTLGRATDRPRNPGNAASGWRKDALAAIAAGASSYTARLPDGATAYAEPIRIQPLCTTCHGAELAPEVRKALDERYPGDRATGYAVGDLRGVLWAEVR